jgi:hypothetical protein
LAKTFVECPRCDGKGWIPRYYYNRKGVCFKCWGAKKIAIKVPAGSTAEKELEKLRKQEADDLDKKPPKQPLPANFKRNDVDLTKEKEAYHKNKPKTNDFFKSMPDGTGTEVHTDVLYGSTYGSSVKGEMATAINKAKVDANEIRKIDTGISRVSAESVSHVTVGQKVKKDSYEIVYHVSKFGLEDGGVKVRFNKKGEITALVPFGKGHRGMKELLEDVGKTAFISQMNKAQQEKLGFVSTDVGEIGGELKKKLEKEAEGKRQAEIKAKQEEEARKKREAEGPKANPREKFLKLSSERKSLQKEIEELAEENGMEFYKDRKTRRMILEDTETEEELISVPSVSDRPDFEGLSEEEKIKKAEEFEEMLIREWKKVLKLLKAKS